MFGGSQPANHNMILDPSLSQGLMNQQSHPFQPHLPSTKHEGEVLPPYQSIKKAVPMMYQDNVEMMERNNNLGAFPNPAMNGQMPLLQQGGPAYVPNQPFPQQYQQGLSPQPLAGGYDNAIAAGTLLYFN